MPVSLNFFKEYCRNVKQIGSIVPDSKTCVHSLVRLVPFDTAQVIVEFGAASGAVTREIIKRKRPGTIFVSFEKNPNLHAALHKRLPREHVRLVNEDVADCAKVLADILGKTGKTVDCIISTLPCSCMDFDALIRRSVLSVLKEPGTYIQYMHTLSMLKGFDLKRSLAPYFDKVVSDLVLFNIPPAVICTCTARIEK